MPDALDHGYHETITVAFLRLILAACQGQVFASSAAFCQAHPELMKKDVLARYYSRERLGSWDAKRAFVEPDLGPLPARK